MRKAAESKRSGAARAAIPARRARPAKAARAAGVRDPAVDALLGALEHPLKREIEALRAAVLGADAAVRECVKWNAPSFYSECDFATVHLRSRTGVQLVLHAGAKPRGAAQAPLRVPDPAGLVRWLAPDRGLVSLGAGAEFDQRVAQLAPIVRAWLRALRGAEAAVAPRPARGARAAKRATSSALAKPAPARAGSAETQAAAALAALESLATHKTRDGLARYGIDAPSALGVSMGDVQKLAKQLGRSHELAEALWKTGVYEARMLTAFVDEPARVSAAQMDRWCRDFDNWAICDTLCFKLFDRTPHAWAKVEQWSSHSGEFQKRAAFALLASLAGHDKTAPDASFERGMRLIEAAATDERNFVKKGVNWALRRIATRNAALRARATALATRLAASKSASARWIGKDALREFARLDARPPRPARAKSSAR